MSFDGAFCLIDIIFSFTIASHHKHPTEAIYHCLHLDIPTKKLPSFTNHLLCLFSIISHHNGRSPHFHIPPPRLFTLSCPPINLSQPGVMPLLILYRQTGRESMSSTQPPVPPNKTSTIEEPDHTSPKMREQRLSTSTDGLRINLPRSLRCNHTLWI